ncbi:MAG: hypothetical protein CME70_05840 [Halobacteriovorax sp.]|nr:hypothetical protein [Halobacteriovorax sp.]
MKNIVQPWMLEAGEEIAQVLDKYLPEIKCLELTYDFLIKEEARAKYWANRKKGLKNRRVIPRKVK